MEIYLTILSRMPTEEELQIVEDARQRHLGRRRAARPRLGADQQSGVLLSALRNESAVVASIGSDERTAKPCHC